MATITQEQIKESAIAEAKMMNNMDGQDEASDVIMCGAIGDAVRCLKDLIPEGAPAMALRGLHLGQMGVTEGKCVNDVYESFLRWSQKPEDKATGRFNISKAFRRLKASRPSRRSTTKRSSTRQCAMRRWSGSLNSLP